MPKKKSKLQVLALMDTYENEFIFLAGTPEEMRDYFYEKKLDEPVSIDRINGAAWLAYNKGSVNVIMVMKDDLGLIIHECVHAIQHAMDDVVIETGVENTEITAYWTEWLCKSAIPFYTKYFAKLKENAK
jgi:hypothetical protein